MQEEKLIKLEQRMEFMFNEIKRLESMFNELTSKIEKTQTAPLVSRTQLESSINDEKIITATTPVQSADMETDNFSDETLAKFLDFLNKASLENLKDLGTDIRNDTLSAVVSKREKDGPFKSREDCVERLRAYKRFSNKTQYNKLVIKWNEKIASSINNSETQPLPKQIEVTESVPSSFNNAAAVKMETSETEPQISLPIAEVKTPSRSRPSSKNKAARGIDKLNDMNKEDLAQILSRFKLSKKLIEAILDQRPFASFDTINISGLGPKKVQAIREVFEK